MREAEEELDTLKEAFVVQLGRAAEEGDLKIIEGLLDTGVNLLGFFTQTGLESCVVAFDRGHSKCVEAILHRTLSLDINPEDHSALLLSFAVRFPSYKALEMLLNNKEKLDVDVNRSWEALSALYWAVAGDHIDLAQKLLHEGADPNSPGLFKIPLSYCKSVECALLLLNYGADVNAVDSYGNSSLTLAAARGNFAVSEVLLSLRAKTELYDSEKGSALAAAAERNYTSLLALLIGFGANLEATDAEGCTPLIRAARHRSLRSMILLLRRGAHAQVKDNKGLTPLHYIVSEGFRRCSKEDFNACVRLLVERNADPDAVDNKGRAPLYYAIRQNESPPVEMLLEHGATSTGKATRLKSPLQIARAGKGGIADVFRAHFLKARLRKLRGVVGFIVVSNRYRETFFRDRYAAVGAQSFATGKRKLQDIM